MDNNNLSINFMGHSADGQLKDALKNRNYNIDLATFYNAVNQSSSNCCSCCKQDNVKTYCIVPAELPIKHIAINLCDECLKSLPLGLSVINIDSNGCPPLLIDKLYEGEV